MIRTFYIQIIPINRVQKSISLHTDTHTYTVGRFFRLTRRIFISRRKHTGIFALVKRT